MLEVLSLPAGEAHGVRRSAQNRKLEELAQYESREKRMMATVTHDALKVSAPLLPANAGGDDRA